MRAFSAMFLSVEYSIGPLAGAVVYGAFILLSLIDAALQNDEQFQFYAIADYSYLKTRQHENIEIWWKI